MTEDFQTLLDHRDQLRAMISDPQVDAIVIDRLKSQMLSALRTAIDELGKVPCEHRPALSRRIDAEQEWLRAAIQVFGGPDA